MLTRRRLLLLGGAAGGAVAAGSAPALASAARVAPADPRAFGALGDGGHDDASALAAAVRRALASGGAAGAATSLRLPPGRYRIARSLSVDASVSLLFDPGAELVPDPGAVLTLHGPVIAGPQRIFSGEGTVRLAHPGAVNVMWFGAEDGKESTATFRKAIDAVMWGKSVTWRQGRGLIEVPPTRVGFAVTALALPSGLRLLGAGGNASRLFNAATDGQPLLIVSGEKGSVVRDVRVEGLYLEGNPRSGDGIRFEDHGYNEVVDCFIRGHGGNGIVARKRQSTMSDGLTLTDVYLTENKGAGLRLERNSHGCAAHNCILVNNDGGNAVISGTYFNMWGGMVNGVEGRDSVRMEGVNCGGFWGVGFEATPVVKSGTVLLRLVATRALVVAGCNFVPSGNDGDCVCIAADGAHDCTLISPFFDANSKGDVLALSVGTASENLQVISPRFGRNHGAGNFTQLDNRSSSTALVSGHGRPLLPAFAAVTAADASMSGDGRRAALLFDRLLHGSATAGFDAATGRFVAPVDGLYHFDAQMLVSVPGGGAAARILLRAGDEAIQGQCMPSVDPIDGGALLATLSCSVRLVRGQAASVEIVAAAPAGATVRGGARFSGHLIA